MFVGFGFGQWRRSFGCPLLNRVEDPLLGFLDLVDDATCLFSSPCPGTVFHLNMYLPCFQVFQNQQFRGSSF